jgi:hypothetical protein
VLRRGIILSINPANSDNFSYKQSVKVLSANIKQKKNAIQALLMNLFWKNSAGIQYKNGVQKMAIWL